jgi:tRNA/tmRNA/rRNA uracil-C5-methylase (TrmA/RlmC/RlmD family)
MNLEAFAEPLDDERYLERVSEMSFDGVEWTPEKIARVRDHLGHWNHNIRLSDGVFTAYCEDYYPAHREIMRVLNEAVGADWTGKRVLDIRCLEGYFSAECASQGASVLGVEGRLINFKNCEFVQSVLGLENLSFAQEDAMEVRREKHGSFDVVLASGSSTTSTIRSRSRRTSLRSATASSSSTSSSRWKTSRRRSTAGRRSYPR